jgi:tyrosyl-tRNA synthetase
VSDEDAEKYIKIFTLLNREEIEILVTEHKKSPHERLLQKRLAEEMTVMVHSRLDMNAAVEASQILFGKGTTGSLQRMNEKTFLSVFEGVPSFDVDSKYLREGVSFADLCTAHSQIFASKGELRRMTEGGGVSLNKIKVESPEMKVGEELLLNKKYLLVQKGKKNYYLIRVV